jgi:hypothetical protein
MLTVAEASHLVKEEKRSLRYIPLRYITVEMTMAEEVVRFILIRMKTVVLIASLHSHHLDRSGGISFGEVREKISPLHSATLHSGRDDGKNKFKQVQS